MWVVTAKDIRTQRTVCIRHYKEFRKALAEVISEESELWEIVTDETKLKCTDQTFKIRNDSVDDNGNGDDFVILYGDILFNIYIPLVY